MRKLVFNNDLTNDLTTYIYWGYRHANPSCKSCLPLIDSALQSFWNDMPSFKVNQYLAYCAPLRSLLLYERETPSRSGIESGERKGSKDSKRSTRWKSKKSKSERQKNIKRHTASLKRVEAYS